MYTYRLSCCATFHRRIVKTLEKSPAVRRQDMEDFWKLFWAAHYTSAAGRCHAAGLHSLAAKQLTALLRFIGIVPADKAFYDAGSAWKLAGRPNMAFVLLNRFLDLVSCRR